VPRTIDHLIAEQDNIDIQGPARKTRHIATTPVAILERVQPAIQCFGTLVSVEPNGQIEKGRSIESNRFGSAGP
jgi:hypothetical protein